MKRIILAGMLLIATFGQTLAREKLVASKFDREHREQRDEAATRWTDGSQMSRTLSTMKLERKVALFLENNREGEYRTLLRDFPRSAKTWNWEISIGEDELKRKTATYEGSGLRLLFAAETSRGAYSAIWVPEEFFEEFAKELQKYGVSPAAIEK